jgi:hypothetical protein
MRHLLLTRFFLVTQAYHRPNSAADGGEVGHVRARSLDLIFQIFARAVLTMAVRVGFLLL